MKADFYNNLFNWNEDTAPPWMKGASLLLFVMALVWAVRALLIGWDASILGPHAFRQAQTAISAYYILNGGPWLAYETPVLGPPWSIPFEFPLYQLLVAAVAKSGMLPLDQAGRLVSILFFLGCLYPAWLILGSLKFARWQKHILLSLFLLSPIYLLWSRTFLIESTALFFSLAFLAAVMAQLERPRVVTLWACALLGSIAGMVKITTWYGFATAALLAFAWSRFALAEGRWRDGLRPESYQLAVAAFGVPALFAIGWTWLADSIKSLNASASENLTSAALQAWNFGTMDQRFSLKMLALIDRSFNEAFGEPLAWCMLLLGLLLLRRRAADAWGAVAMFFLGIFTFTNLHLAHNYYQYAASIFLVFALGTVLVRMLAESAVHKMLAALGIAYIAHAQIQVDWNEINTMHDQSRMDVALASKAHTLPNQVLVIFGDDWASGIPYYSERRALMDYFIHPFPDGPVAKRAIKDIKQYSVGAGVFCKRFRSHPDLMQRALDTFDLQPAPVFSNDMCQIHLPKGRH